MALFTYGLALQLVYLFGMVQSAVFLELRMQEHWSTESLLNHLREQRKEKIGGKQGTKNKLEEKNAHKHNVMQRREERLKNRVWKRKELSEKSR